MRKGVKSMKAHRKEQWDSSKVPDRKTYDYFISGGDNLSGIEYISIQGNPKRQTDKMG